MGNIVKRQYSEDKPARYYIRFKDQAGRWKWEAAGKRRKDADALLRRRESEVAEGTYGRDDATFAAYSERWLRGKQKSLKVTSYLGYEHNFRNHITPFLGKRLMSEIDADKVQDWVNHMADKDLSPATVWVCYRYLRACLRTAYNRGLMKSYPCRDIDLPRVNREELSYLAPSEVMALVEEAEEPERTLFATLGLSGLRRGEGLALAWRHVSFKDRAIIVERSYSPQGGMTEPKSSSSRRAVSILPTLEGILRENYERQGRPNPDALLFSSDGTRPLDPATVRRKFHRALDGAGLKRVTIHSLRHTFASTLLASGASIKAVQMQLGHSSATMTLDVYGHLLQESIQPAMNRADALFSNPEGKIALLPKQER